MPNIKSAAKRMKTSRISNLRNRQVKSTVITARTRLAAALAEGDAKQTATLFSAFCSELDLAVKKGVLPANNANRRKSRMALQIAKQQTKA